MRFLGMTGLALVAGFWAQRYARPYAEPKPAPATTHRAGVAEDQGSLRVERTSPHQIYQAASPVFIAMSLDTLGGRGLPSVPGREAS